MVVSESRKLISEWNFAKNEALGFDPNKLSIKSHRKVWWKCSKGHEWESVISNELLLKNCPYCSKRRLLKGYNDLLTTHPEIAKQWNMEKNHGVAPDDVTSVSQKRVVWKCDVCGQEWYAKVKDRTVRKTGCPNCAKAIAGRSHAKTMLKKNGSLAEQRKDLLIDWDYDKNTITPNEITAHSNTRVWWKCHECGHQWQAKASNRANGRGCPCCAGKILVSGKNDLETTHPALAQEWHPTKNNELTPRDVMYGQSLKVWWKCPNGHSYLASLNHRSGANGTNCQVCNDGRQTSFREQALYFYLKQIFPDAINRFKCDWLGRFEIDIFIPSIKVGLEYDGAAWHKKDKFPRERRKYQLCQEHGIKLVRVKEAMPDKNNMSCDIADRIISVKDVESKHNFEKLLRVAIDETCSFACQGNKNDTLQKQVQLDIDVERDKFRIVVLRYNVKNSLAKKHPSIAKEWHPERNGEHVPTMFPCGSDFKAWWLCPKCGRSYVATISHRTNGGGCTCDSKERFAESYRMKHVLVSGGITDHKLLAEWNYEKNGSLKPEDIPPKSEMKVWWRCRKCCHEWQAKIANRAIGRGCPCCSNHVVVKGKNDLATLFPNLVKEWNWERNGNLTPDNIVPGRNKPVWWKCSECGYEWQAPPARRTRSGSGCRKCADKALRKNNSVKT